MKTIILISLFYQSLTYDPNFLNRLLQVKLIESQSVFAKQTTHLLDRLLLNYNKYSRPSSSEPTKVHINLQIKDIAHDRKEMVKLVRLIH